MKFHKSTTDGRSVLTSSATCAPYKHVFGTRQNLKYSAGNQNNKSETMDTTVHEVSDGEAETEVKVQPQLSAVERLAAKKRARAQKRLSTMKNKVLRNAQWASLKKEKRKVLFFSFFAIEIFFTVHHNHLTQVKKEQQKKRREEAEALGDKAPPKQVPRTIENTREHDITTIDPEDEEVQFDITNDEYQSYFAKTYQPKVLITSSDNPHTAS